jgi:lysophospholipase L1-like esterase
LTAGVGSANPTGVPVRMRRRPSAATRLGLVLAAIGLALAVVEAGLRLVAVGEDAVPGYAWLRRDPIFGTVNVPGTYVDRPFGGGSMDGTVVIDADGMRGVPLDPDHRRRRIVCLGDSSTFGIRLVDGHSGRPEARFRADNAYPEMLGTLLDAETVNAGVIGHTAPLGLRRLRGLVLPLRPDVVVARYGFNDHLFPTALVPEPSPPLACLFYGTSQLATAKLVAAARTRTRKPSYVSLGDYRRALNAMADVAAAHGITLVLLDYPLRPLAPGESENDAGLAALLPPLPALYETQARYARVTAEVAAARGLTLVRTDDVITFGPHDRVHPDAAGARAIAERVAAAL